MLPPGLICFSDKITAVEEKTTNIFIASGFHKIPRIIYCACAHTTISYLKNTRIYRVFPVWALCGISKLAPFVILPHVPLVLSASVDVCSHQLHSHEHCSTSILQWHFLTFVIRCFTSNRGDWFNRKMTFTLAWPTHKNIAKKAIRFISNAKYNSHTTPMFKNLHLLQAVDIFKLACFKLFYKCNRIE